MKPELPSIYDYDDYRMFLRDWVAARAERGRFSARGFARRAGFRAHNILQLVIQGKRNLSPDSIRKFCEGLQLSANEAACFEDLVLLNQAGTQADRVHYYQRLVGHPGRRQTRPMEAAQLSFFSHWLAPVVYEMIRFPEFKPDPSWIAERIGEPVTPAEIRGVLETLQCSGLVAVASDGSWRQAEPQVHSGDDVRNVHLFSYHERALEKAADALHEVPAAQRHFHVLTTAVSNELLPRLVELALKYEAEVWQLIESDKREPDQVIQVGMQLFPTVRPKDAPALRPRTERKRK